MPRLDSEHRRAMGTRLRQWWRFGPGNTLFFTAGPDHETNGLFGTLTPVTAELQADDEQ